MVADAVEVREPGVVVAPPHQAARRGLLEGHSDGTVAHRPGLAVAGVEAVEDLAHEVGLPRLVEPGGDSAAERVEPVLLRSRKVGIHRSRRRREEVRRVTAHLVQVHRDVRVPVEVEAQAPAGLGLRLREPVAVHVEEVVVPAAARPRLVVLGGGGLGVGAGGAAQGVRGQEARAAVRVLEGIHEHDGLATHELGAGVVLRGEEVVGQRERRVRRRDLVPVDGVEEPHDGRELAHEAIGLGGRQASAGRRARAIALWTASSRARRSGLPRTSTRRGRPSSLLAYSTTRARSGAAAASAARYAPISSGLESSSPSSWPVTCFRVGMRGSYRVSGPTGEGTASAVGEGQGGEHGVSFDVS